jgi:hypothetical protein
MQDRCHVCSHKNARLSNGLSKLIYLQKCDDAKQSKRDENSRDTHHNLLDVKKIRSDMGEYQQRGQSCSSAGKKKNTEHGLLNWIMQIHEKARSPIPSEPIQETNDFSDEMRRGKEINCATKEQASCGV